MTPAFSKHFSETDRLTSIILVVANLVPLVGVLFYDWELKNVMLLYWIENLIVGAINILRIVFMANDQHLLSRLFASGFFTLHYGIFCMAHGALLFELLAIRIDGLEEMFSPIDMLLNASLIIRFLQDTMGETAILALFAMLISHGLSLRMHYFKNGERRRMTVSKAMHLPYQRIVVMHIGLIAGAFLIEEFGSPLYLLLALIVAKVATDVVFHRKEHQKLRVKA